MRTVIKKLFWAWESDKEEQWLAEMAAKGLALVGVGFCRYEFEDCVPGEYSVRIELLDNRPDHPESRKYISFVEETGAEHVGSYLNWVYFRKKGDFELFSDYTTKIKHLTKIIRLLAVLSVLNLAAFLYNFVVVLAIIGEPVSLLSCINLFLAIFIAIGIQKLRKKREALKTEQNIFE